MTQPIYVVPPELQSKVIEWRHKSAQNTITLDEMKQAIILLRQGRRLAAEASTTSKSTSKKKPVTPVSDMLNELNNL